MNGMASWGQWIQLAAQNASEAAMDGLSRWQPAEPQRGNFRRSAHQGEDGNFRFMPGQRPARKSTSALAEAMRQRGGVQAVAEAGDGGSAEGSQFLSTDTAGNGPTLLQHREHGDSQPRMQKSSSFGSLRGGQKTRRLSVPAMPSMSPSKGPGASPGGVSQQSSGAPWASQLGNEFTSFIYRGQGPAGARKDEKPRRSPKNYDQGRRPHRPVWAHPAQSFLKQWFASWISSTGFTQEQIRFAGSQMVNVEVSSLSGQETQHLLDAFFVVQGVEVLVKVMVVGLHEEGEKVNLIAEGATTKCRWETAAQCVTAAARASIGQPLEDLIAALLSAFQAAPNEEAHFEKQRERRHSLSTCSVVSEELPSTCVTPRDGDHSPARTEVSCCTSVSARPAAPPSAGDSFRMWLRSRPPLLRFQAASRGLAWDFPPSRAEKHELLLLQLFSQEAERHQEMETVRRRSSLAPSTASSSKPVQYRSLRGSRSMSSAAF